MKGFTVKVFLNDGSRITIDCDDFVATDNGYYYAVKDGVKFMTFPFCSVKCTATVCNENEGENESMDRI